MLDFLPCFHSSSLLQPNSTRNFLCANITFLPPLYSSAHRYVTCPNSCTETFYANVINLSHNTKQGKCLRSPLLCLISCFIYQGQWFKIVSFISYWHHMLWLFSQIFGPSTDSACSAQQINVFASQWCLRHTSLVPSFIPCIISPLPMSFNDNISS